MAHENADLVVIGAGWHGLAVAKTYVQLNPSSKLIVLDSSPTIGGVWARHRLYPGLKSNNMIGTYEYSDFPMGPEFGVKPGEHIPGEVVHQYLEAYAKHFGVYPRVRLGMRVDTVEKRAGGEGWLIGIERGDEIVTKKLVVATGLTSDPFLPDIPGARQFGNLFFHSGDLRQHEHLLKTANRVAIFGGTKSAWDCVYAFAAAGAKVDWIIRKSGHGPVWMAPPYVTPLKKWLEKLVTTRFLTWFSPCVWGEADGFRLPRRFLHGTTLGRWIVDRFWSILEGDVIALNQYDKHPETRKLKPWYSPFWIGSGLSIFNYPTDFMELVRQGRVKIHIRDIEKLSPNSVQLSSGETLTVDAVICATGWKHRPSIKFVPESLEAELGLASKSAENRLDRLTVEADQEVLKRFPKLNTEVIINPEYKPITGYKSPGAAFNLYRFMIPPAFASNRSIVFCGMESTINTSLCAQTQALWISAYFSGKLSLDHKSQEEIEKESVLHNRFGKWRYPAGYGAQFPDFVFDAIPYIDLMLRDLGLPVHRKKGLLKECFEPYGVEDYRGLVEEWVGSEDGI